MKKRDFLFACALLAGFSLPAMAQNEPESQMFFFGFEDGLESFTDSSNPVEVIEKINYYAADPTGDGASWDIVFTKDSIMPLLHGYSPATRDGEKDFVDVMIDTENEHSAEFEKMGAQGGDKYLKWATAAKSDNADCNDYEANLFVRGLNIEDETSYRLVFYLKSQNATGNVQAGIFRGQYNSEKPLSMNGASGNEFLLELKEFKEDTWERYTMMAYYQNDSVATHHMYKAGYWWDNSWACTDPETGTQYNKIEQFDTYFVRFAFRSPSSTFYLDDVALYKSWIGGAEYNRDIIRIDFGYQTNLADLAKADPNGAIELPGEYFTVTGIDEAQGPDRMEIPVLSAEYHSDGYLYMWLDDECDYYEDILVSVKNPVDDPKLALKYTGSLYPKSLDQAWVDAGKLLPDFENEFVLPNPDVNAISIEFLAPSVAGSTPETGSFNLASDTKSIDVKFSKKVFVDIAAGKQTNGVLAQMKGDGYWLPTAYDEDTYTVTFTRENTGDLKGDYDFEVMNIRAGQEDVYEAGPNATLQFSFGEITGGEPITYLKTDEAWAASETHPEQCIPLHWGSTPASGTDFEFGNGTAQSGKSRMYWYAAGSDFAYGMYISPRGGSSDARFVYGAEEGTPLTLEQGDYWLSFKIVGWDNVYSTEVYFYPLNEEPGEAVMKITPDNSVASGSANQKSFVVDNSTSARANLTVPTTGNYVIEFRLPKGAGWTGSLIGGIELTNQYSAAYKYIKLVNEANASAAAVLANAKANAIYSGADLTTFEGVVAKYAEFKSTAPTDYENAAKEVKDATTAMSNRMSTVDKFYTAYKAATDKEALYKDSVDYNTLAAFTAMQGKIAEYASYDCTSKTSDEITAATNEVTAATQAMTDRCTAIDTYNNRKGQVETIVTDQVAYAILAEYKACTAVLDKYIEFNLFTSTDEELNAASEEIKAAREAFNNKLDAAKLKIAQNQSLASMATEFEVEFDTEVAARIAELSAVLLEDDQELASLYELGIKAKLCEIMGAGEFEDALAMTAFMQNPGFYNVYSPSTKIHENVNPLPGWECLGGHGNDYLTAYGNERCQTEGGVKSIDIALDWNSGVILKQDLKNLPAGQYTFGYSISGWGTPKGNCNGSFIFTEYDAEGAVLFSDTIAFDGSGDAVPFTAHGGVVEFKADLNSASTWAFIDNFTLTLNAPLEGYDYEAAVEEINSEFTIVNRVAQEAEAKYYNLNGIEVKNPAGVAIKVVNGKAQKVLVK